MMPSMDSVPRRWVCVALAAMALSACVRPTPRTLDAATLGRLQLEPRDVVITDIDVIDARSEADKKPLQPTMRYFVPLLIWFQWSQAGDVRPDAKYYSKNLPAEMSDLVRRAFNESGFLAKKPSPNARKLRLTVQLDQLYGITHADSVNFVTLGSSATTERTFAPYGFASARVRLLDEKGHLLADQRVNGSFDPDFGSLVDPGEKSVQLQDRLTLSAVSAAGSLATNIVRALEVELAADEGERGQPYEERATFFISRLTSDGAFIEVAGIEAASGRVISDMVVKRWMEPYSAVGEWVVDPYQGGRSRLSGSDYTRLIEHLAQSYEVRFVSDVRTAHFFGVLPGASVSLHTEMQSTP